EGGHNFLESFNNQDLFLSSILNVHSYFKIIASILSKVLDIVILSFIFSLKIVIEVIFTEKC
ncbi:unnamed protein product, partial [marine sediment metagenome]